MKTIEPQVQIARTLEELHQVEPIWDAVRAPWASPTLSYDFVRSCAEAYEIADRLSVVISTSGSHAAIAHLYESEAAPRLGFVGQNQIFEASDFLYNTADDLIGLARAIVALGRPLRMTCVPANSAAVEALEKAYRGRGLVIKRPAASCQWIALDQSWEEPEQHLNSGRRSDLRRARRSAEKLGAVTFDVCSPEPSELEGMLSELYEIEAAGWKAKGGSAMTVDTRMGAFYKSYAAAACRKKVLRLAFMRIDGKAVAAQLAVEANGGYWILKIGYSEEFKRCSPGVLLILETIRHSAKTGLKFYEFLGAEEEWIQIWKPNLRPCIELRTYPFNFYGARALIDDAFITLCARLGPSLNTLRGKN